MAFASFKGAPFRFGFSVLQLARERDLKAYKYPGRSGAEHEDFGALPHQFTVEADFPGTAEGHDDLIRFDRLFEESTSGLLEIPRLGAFTCFFSKFQESAEAGGSGAKRVEMVFVETLPETLVIERSLDELEDMGRIPQLLDDAVFMVNLPQPLPAIELAAWLQTLLEILEFIQEVRQKIKAFQQKIQDIQDAITRPYNELMRLAADIEQTANQARSLYRSVIKFAQLPYTLAMRLKNTANILTSIARRFLPPPVDRRGQVLPNQFHGQVVMHRVVGGETMQSISVLHYDSALLWECLAEANGIFDANAIEIGDLLVIPDFAGRRKQRVEIRPGKTRIGQASCEV